jgi:hypothetical protein
MPALSMTLAISAALVLALFATSCDSPTPPAAGPEWTTQAVGVDFIDVQMFSATDGVAVGRMGTVMRVGKGGLGESIGIAGGPDLAGVWGASRNDFYAAGADGEVYHYNGKRWTATGTGNAQWLTSIWGDATGRLFAVGRGGTALRYDGAQWHSDPTGTDEELLVVHGVPGPGGHVFACGRAGTVLRYDGSSWTDLEFPLPFDVYAMWAFANDDVYVVNSSILMGFDGITWQYGPLYVSGEWSQADVAGMERPLQAIGGTTDDAMVVVGWFGTVAAFDGSEWTTVNAGPALETIESMRRAPGGEVWAAGWTSHPGHFDGTEWQWEDYPIGVTQDELTCVWADATGEVWAAGRKFTPRDGSGVIARLDDGEWTTVFNPSAPINDIFGASPTDIRAVGDDGVTVRYDGDTWHEIVTFDGAADYYAVWGIANVNNSESNAVYHAVSTRGMAHLSGDAWWKTGYSVGQRLYAIWGVSDREIFCAGVGGNVVKGRGGAWDYMSIPTRVDLHGVWASGANDVYVIGDAGTIFHWDGTYWIPMRSGVTARLTSICGFPKGRVFAGGDNGFVLKLE